MSMHRPRSSRGGWVCLALGLAAVFAPAAADHPAAHGQAAQLPTVYVLDEGRKTVHRASFGDGSMISSPAFPEEPGSLTVAPDGGTLLVFNKPPLSTFTGSTDSTLDGTPFVRPKAPSDVSIIDTSTMTVRATINQIGWNATPVVSYSFRQDNGYWKQALSTPAIWGAWDSSGRRFTIVCWGKDDQPAEAVQIDVPSASITGRLRLGDRVGDIGHYIRLNSGESAVVLCRNSIVFLNLHDISSSRNIPIRGDKRSWALSPKDDVLYFHGSGAGGSGLLVISLKSLTVTKAVPVPAVAAIANDPERGQTLFVGSTKAGPFLWAFRGEEQVPVGIGDTKRDVLPLADTPLDVCLAPKTKRLYVLCWDSLQVIDLETLGLVGSIASPRRTTGTWESGTPSAAPPTILALDSSEERGFLGYSNDDEISVLDLKTLKVVGLIDVVSGLGNFGRMMAGAAALGAVQGAAAAGAGRPLSPPPPDAALAIQPPKARYSRMMVDPDDRFLYVLDVNRVRVIDIANRKKLDDLSHRLFSVSSLELMRGSADSFLLVHGSEYSTNLKLVSRRISKMVLFDTRTNKKLAGKELGGDVIFTPDGRYVMHFDDGAMYCRDAANWSVLKTIDGFKRITRIVIPTVGSSH